MAPYYDPILMLIDRRKLDIIEKKEGASDLIFSPPMPSPLIRHAISSE